MTKRILRKCLGSSTLLLLLILFLMMFAYTDMVKAEPADSLWIEPSTIEYYTTTTSVGKLFNVTLYTNVSAPAYSWQVQLFWNTSHLNTSRAGYTGGGNSEFFNGHATVPVVPTYDYEQGALLHGESLIGDDSENGTGSLFWVEFEIIAAPNATIGTLASELIIDSTLTYVLGTDLNEIDTLKHSANYSLTFVSDTTGPTIGTPVQDPQSDNVQPDQDVKVSVNVTDAESGVKNVTLHYTNNTVWYNVSMSLNTTSGLWEGFIPGHIEDTQIQYKITAYDNKENFAETNGGEYFTYTVIPEFTSMMLFSLMAIATLAAIVTRKKFEG